jgi:hypothetical protein
MSVSGHPILVRRAEPGDAEAIHSIFCGPKAIAGTLQIPYGSVEMWRKRIAECRKITYCSPPLPARWSATWDSTPRRNRRGGGMSAI